MSNYIARMVTKCSFYFPELYFSANITNKEILSPVFDVEYFWLIAETFFLIYKKIVQGETCSTFTFVYCFSSLKFAGFPNHLRVSTMNMFRRVLNVNDQMVHEMVPTIGCTLYFVNTYALLCKEQFAVFCNYGLVQQSPWTAASSWARFITFLLAYCRTIWERLPVIQLTTEMWLMSW